MFAYLALVLLVTAGPAPAENWEPFHAFVGRWSGTRTSSAGRENVRRAYESIAGQHLLVTDHGSSDRSLWGMVSFEPSRGFVLKRFGPDGSTEDLLLSQVSDDGTTLIFDRSTADGSSQERIIHQRLGRDEFVERVERRTGEELTVVSEARFRRKP